ncbi:MAG TPA: ATP-dependent RecD-like DNA helicase [Clostridiaceae bacterium]
MPEIEGSVESIIYKNDDNGYVVAQFKDKNESITIVGTIPYITQGHGFKLKGSWVKHPQFGKQFKVESSEEIRPLTTVGIEKYLASGVISGIGPVTAKKIVEHFGEETLEILDFHIERLKEIEGIGEKKIALICNSYSKQREVKNIMVFLQTYEVSANQCLKIFKKYGENSITTVKANPYILCEEISGIGFKTADKIARNLGIDENSPYRIQSGLNYIINEYCSIGNTYMPMDKLIDEGINILSVKREEIEENILNSASNLKLKVDIINELKCVYTMPYYYCELGVTKNLYYLANSSFDDMLVNIKEEVEEFEKIKKIKFATSQKEAIIGAFQNGIEVITGGPGTGKTTIINAITYIYEKAGYVVYMAAPTGRAAKRMSEATGREAKTIHRLLELGYHGEEDNFQGEDITPLECNVLIVDEASMIDIMLMNSLLKALAMGTRLIIVGDVDQLPSVGPGNVLKDIIESGYIKVVKLQDIFRQAKESLIVLNAHKINNGQMPILNERDKDFFFIKGEQSDVILNTLLELIDKRLPAFNKGWDKLKHLQVLTPMRKGILGVFNLNNKLQELLNPKEQSKNEIHYRDVIFREGDKVMQTKNNYSLVWMGISDRVEREGTGVFNGDVGYIEKVDKEDSSISIIYDDERRVIYENVLLDELELAYAITIHKSQGSEFPVVIMPVFMGPPLLMNRNLLYTAITRAKEMVVLIGSSKAINYMINNKERFERYSGLGFRISGVMGGDLLGDDGRGKKEA